MQVLSKFLDFFPNSRQHLARWARPWVHRLRHGELGQYTSRALEVPGWTTYEELRALAYTSYALPPGAVIVEVGTFLGRSTLVLAGGRKLKGSGEVQCIDPFDASGDEFSVPHYQAIARKASLTLRERFDQSMRQAGLQDWLRVHPTTVQAVAEGWSQPIDFLFLDGDQSPQGARASYELLAPFLKPGGLLALHNSSDRTYAEGHDGYYRLALETVRPPLYTDIHCVDTTTFARKLG
ncbi:class I SAM-dependent methyltransferase [Allomeiothermus silvanus]|uniref:class I SAM-dependent methyltransferase n=1 Tax=Allomeiothermus silvanus TaxID=52022 RepID=UPI0023F373C7|nr:class I SAM-dependent methyltransferase [Allomeiothermus silvanus]